MMKRERRLEERKIGTYTKRRVRRVIRKWRAVL